MRRVGARPGQRTRATEKRLDIAYVFDGDVPAAISGDVTRLRQILLNLLSNAVKFTEAGEVVLTVTRAPAAADASTLTFAVRDTGIGLSPSGHGPPVPVVLAGRLVSTTRKYGGTGLGLAISKRLAELMGGTMWVESAGPGRGLDLPLHHRGAGRRSCRPSARREFVGAQPALQGKRLLVVDDNATNRRILALQAAKWGMRAARHRVAGRGAALARSGRAFDLAILDMHMPEMDGVDLAARVRASRPRVAAGAVQLARPARGRRGRQRCSPPTWRSRCTSRSCSTRWSACWRTTPRRGRAGAGREAEDRCRRWRRAIRCASCWPRTTS